MMRLPAWAKRSATVYFAALSLLSVLLLTAMFAIFNGLWDQLLVKYKTEYLDDQSLKLAFVVHDLIRQGPLTEERIGRIDGLARQYAGTLKYTDPLGEQVWLETGADPPPAAEPYVVELPMVTEGRLGGILTATYDLGADNFFPYFTNMNRTAKRQAKGVFAGLLAVALALSFWLAMALSRPLRANAKRAHRIVNGDLEAFVPEAGTSEQVQFVQAVNYLLTEFRQQEKWRKQMMQDLTHELRTPLTTVLSRLEAMIDGIYPLSESNMNLIYAEIDRLSRLVKDVGKLSEAEGARFTLNVRRVDMAQLLARVREGFLFLAQEKRIRFAMQPIYVPCYAEVDPDRVIQIVSNVVSNAIKYTPPGGEVELRLLPGETETTVCCADKGIGIADEDLPHIFNRFYRADKSRSRESGGLGVGLSIARALAEAHGGAIEVKSELEVGSTFFIRLPNAYDSNRPGTEEMTG